MRWRIHLPGLAPLMLAAAVLVMALLIVMPLGVVFSEAFGKGVGAFLAAFGDDDLWAAIRLTLTVAAISVPLNAVFGLAAAWSIAKFEFRGKSLLLAVIDLPFSMSPVVSGLVWVLLFGAQGWFGPWLQDHDVRIIFTTSGIVLATITVTLPFVARELIPLMQDQGTDEEAAAVTLGAHGFTIFRRITLPNVRWALLYGVLLCNARAMGEFGAVSVVSGKIRGLTNTLPLHIEALYNDYDFVGAFAAASILASLGLVTLLAKTILEWRHSDELSLPDDGDENLALEITGISKSFGRYPALKDVSFAAADREFLALLGPSGSGKTTLLRVLAGLETPDAGEVRFGGEDYLAIPARRRRAGMVFQHYALFRHMTVAQNIAFGLKVRPRAERPSTAEVNKRVGDLLDLVQLAGLDKRYPAQLSGGQRQRVALARALAIEPRMLLLDEPFGALDAQVRRDLRQWLREVHDRAGVTTVFVTHDQEEALDLADRVAILRDGKLIQLGKPQTLYDHPASAFVYDFLGPACRLPGVVEQGRLRIGDWIAPAGEDAPAGEVDVYFRPDEVEFAPQDGAGLAAQVRGTAARGPQIRIDCLVDGRAMELLVRDTVAPAGVATGLSVRFRPTRFKLYPRSA